MKKNIVGIVVLGVTLLVQSCSSPERDNPLDPVGANPDEEFIADMYSAYLDGLGGEVGRSSGDSFISSGEISSSIDEVFGLSSSSFSATLSSSGGAEVSSLPVIIGGNLQYATTTEDTSFVYVALLTVEENEDSLAASVRWEAIEPPRHGVLKESTAEFWFSVEYEPAPDYNGLDTIMIEASNEYGADSVIIIITVLPVNDPPQFFNKGSIEGLFGIGYVVEVEKSTVICNDSLDNADATLSYSWFRDLDTLDNDGVAIGSNALSYLVQEEDINSYIYVEIECTDDSNVKKVNATEYSPKITSLSVGPQLIGFNVTIDDTVSNGYVVGGIDYSDPRRQGVTLSIIEGNDLNIFTIQDDTLRIADDTHLYWAAQELPIVLKITADDGFMADTVNIVVDLTKIPFDILINDFSSEITGPVTPLFSIPALDEFNPELIFDNWEYVSKSGGTEIIVLGREAGGISSMSFAVPGLTGATNVIVRYESTFNSEGMFHISAWSEDTGWRNVEISTRATQTMSNLEIPISDFGMSGSDVDSLRIYSNNGSSIYASFDYIRVNNN